MLAVPPLSAVAAQVPKQRLQRTPVLGKAGRAHLSSSHSGDNQLLEQLVYQPLGGWGFRVAKEREIKGAVPISPRDAI
jgi:hypothetical protein